MDSPWFRFYEESVPRSLDYPAISLPDLLDRSAGTWPDKVALRFFVDPKLPSSTMTYAELQRDSRRFALALAHLGVKKGDRVALMLPNCPQFVVAFYGVLRLGAIAVNTNPLYVSREMADQFTDAGCETVVMLNQFYPRLQEAQSRLPIKRVIVVDIAETMPWWVRFLVHMKQKKEKEYVEIRPQGDIFSFQALVAQHAPQPHAVEIKPDDVALFQYTGGTTGVPKAAMLTHRNLTANTLQLNAWFTQVQPGHEVCMGAIPFFHVYGMTTCMLFGIWIGAEVVMLPRPRPVDNVMKLLQRCSVTIFPGVPTLYTAINSHPDVKKYRLGSVKACISGAAPLPLEVQQKFESLTGGKLVEGYGLTEAAPVTHANPLLGQRRTGSSGLPLPDVEARIVDLDTKQIMPAGSEGELAVRGPQVMLGYWNRPEETAKMIRDGWLHTGDIARMDADGYFYIVDRAKDMIIASGLKVLPREVEEVLFLHPKVQEAVVAGVPDAYRGETVKAFVILKPGVQATEAEIVEFCKQHLAPFKVPKAIEFRTELPKTLVGKYLRRVLVEEEKAKQARKA